VPAGGGGGGASKCEYACSDYGYLPGDCDLGWYCRYADGCLEEDVTCN
jgi:hypothetical protein